MNRTAAQHLRGLLGEGIPSGGTETDTMFTDDEVDDFLEMGAEVNSNFATEAAAYYGWREKMANYANMVTVNEGNAMRELTELHKAAKRMVDQYVAYVPTPGRGRAKLGVITRDNTY